jgi:hypothetical protein
MKLKSNFVDFIKTYSPLKTFYKTKNLITANEFYWKQYKEN